MRKETIRKAHSGLTLASRSRLAELAVFFGVFVGLTLSWATAMYVGGREEKRKDFEKKLASGFGVGDKGRILLRR